jgi:hypothetical protein
VNTKTNFFAFNDYRDLVLSQLHLKFGRGGRLKLAEALNCQPGYISQVLNKSKINFSTESIMKVSAFLKLNPTEEEFLIMLLEYEKAGSEDLKNFWNKKIQTLKQENLKIEKQISQTSGELGPEAKSIYYSHWSYAFVHMLVSLENYKNPENILQKVGLDRKHINKVLDFLLKEGLININEGKLEIGATRIHLPASSPLIKAHHQNFRQMAIAYLDQDNELDLHYSSILTLGKEDCLQIKNLILKLIKDKEQILLPSPNEEIICLNLDFFQLIRN